MSVGSDALRPKRARKVERIAPALVLLAQGAQAVEAARKMGVSTVTILNWMDWSWRHRAETQNYLTQHYPELNEADLATLWGRIERRRAKRQRRLNLTDVLSRSESSSGAERVEQT